MATPNFWEEMSEEAHRDRRREQRVGLAFPIEVCGLDVEERFFTERSVTSSVSESGCRFHLNAMLGPDATVAIRLTNRETGAPMSQKALLFQVVWSRYENGGWTYGVHGLQEEDLWGIAFPGELSESLRTA